MALVLDIFSFCLPKQGQGLRKISHAEGGGFCEVKGFHRGIPQHHRPTGLLLEVRDPVPNHSPLKHKQLMVRDMLCKMVTIQIFPSNDIF